ncbi:restriction endonuclease subunit S [Thiolapillus sp.]|uniref:restriction endonuclease subunit S n=1 Tax=Thiolapillus sp. TaxID=2017437 RepID=UPI003AF5CFDF
MSSKSDKKKSLVPRLRFPEFREAGAWEKKRLGTQGGFLTPLSGKSAKDFDTGDAKFIPYMNVFSNTFTDIQDLRSVIITDDESQNAVAKGDVFFTVSSETPEEAGMSSVLLGDVDRCYLNSFCALFRFDDHLSPNLIFLGYLLRSRSVRCHLSRGAQGATRYNISKLVFKELPLVFPLAKEQQKIAHCLSSLDEVIGLQAKKVQALKQHKKGLMQQLFPAEGETTPRLRFPEFREAGAWEFIPLEAIAPLVNDRVQLKDISNVNYVSTENILQDFGGVAVANKLPTVNSVSSFQAGDVLLANIRPYLKKVWAANFSGGASNDVLVFRPRNSQGGQYVAHILKNNRFINYVMAGAKGVKMPRGDINSIKEYPVPIPPETTEQQKIAHCLSFLDEVIGLEAHKLDALKTHKKGLMQQLFPSLDEVQG